MSRQLHVVFGVGQIGRLLVDELAAAGHRVRAVSRSGADLPGQIEVWRGDASDEAFARQAAAGATAVYHTLNAPYSTAGWTEHLPRLQARLIDAAARAGARLVVLENLYALGAPGRSPLHQDDPPRPAGPKGELRARLSAELLAAHRAGTVAVAAGRASDFLGPGVTQAVLGERFFAAAAGDAPVELFGDIDAVRSFGYAPDVARGLATLGTHPGAVGRAWHLPVLSPVSPRALATSLLQAMQSRSRLRRLPGLAVRLLGLVSAPLRELTEVLPTWDAPYLVDDGPFGEAFGWGAHALPGAVAATAAWARDRSARVS